MGFRFRPYPGLTIGAVILVTILIGLGVWQLQRLQWKLALIATVSGHMTVAPVSLDAALAMTPDEVLEFKNHSHAQNAVRLRRWDDAAKIPQLPTPPLSHFATYLHQVALRDSPR